MASPSSPPVSAFLAAAAATLGGRLADGRFDPYLGLEVAVVDLTDHDAAVLEGMAAELGLAHQLRVESVGPADLAAWLRLRQDLRRLDAEQPQLLLADPGLDRGYQRPPVGVHLTAAAEAGAAAADLRRRYDGLVDVHVGSRPGRLGVRGGLLRCRPAAGVRVEGGDDLSVALSGPLSVRRGDTVVHGLDVTAHGDHAVVLHTAGVILARVVDPETGAVVGGPDGWLTQAQVAHTVDPGETRRMPLLVGTAGSDPALGPRIPAGAWALIATFDHEDGRHLTSAPLDLTIRD